MMTARATESATAEGQGRHRVRVRGRVILRKGSDGAQGQNQDDHQANYYRFREFVVHF